MGAEATYRGQCSGQRRDLVGASVFQCQSSRALRGGRISPIEVGIHTPVMGLMGAIVTEVVERRFGVLPRSFAYVTYNLQREVIRAGNRTTIHQLTGAQNRRTELLEPTKAAGKQVTWCADAPKDAKRDSI